MKRTWRFWLALWGCKITDGVIRLLGKSGTTLPGVVANRLDPRIISHLGRGNYPEGIIIVTGTNGKTTTANLLANVLKQAGKKFSFNEAGANLVTGITGAMARNTGWLGRTRAKLALWEVDEATVPQLCAQITPTQAIVTNFFRDQLDRYGELDTTVRLVREVLPESTRLILNADDPLVAQFGLGRQDVVYFGVERTPESSERSDETREARFCPQCGAELAYSLFHYGQLGRFSCPVCTYQRPEPQIQAREVRCEEQRIVFQVDGQEGSLALPGYYNLYNALAAYSSAKTLGIASGTIMEGLRGFAPQAGRMEAFALRQGRVILTLVKNPAGFNQVIRTVLGAASRQPLRLLLAINDQAADGRDVSWLWDVDFELLQAIEENISLVICAGLRAEDMVVRLKYAGITEEKIRLEDDLAKAVALLQKDWGSGGQAYALPTYTALRPLRDILAAKSRQAGAGSGRQETRKSKEDGV
ncbi:MAG: Mur ligase family protein [Peptococcaceae bacterium]|nr:Mur ligase family protein [Peptococcaceae bacterium]